MEVLKMDYNYFNYEGVNKPRRVTKSMLIDETIYRVQNMYNVQVTNTVRLSETAQSIRHSCIYTGISILPMYTLQIATDYGYIDVYYYFCVSCGKLYIAL